MKVRLKDIAQRAGVSEATVSNALNNRAGVSPRLADEIQKLADEMGYRTAKVSRNVKPYIRYVLYKRHGHVLSDAQFFSDLMQGAEQACREFDQELIVTTIRAGADSDRIRTICDDECTGVILFATEMEADDLDRFKVCRSPLLVVDNPFTAANVHSVSINNYQAMFQATEIMINAGHKHIGFITGDHDIPNFAERRNGYEAAMKAHGYPVTENSYWLASFEPPYTASFEADLQNGRQLPTAFVCANDHLAVVAMHVLQERGIQIPEQVSFIGMDNVSISENCVPPLTTMQVFRREMGRTAVFTLINTIPRLRHSYVKMQLTTEPVIRGTVSGPPV